ncbi:MAG: hypothetical protein HY721_15220 [Planctomycetes bacterium]|nr:hypothetical protein [Planctomycetota bacterium]
MATVELTLEQLLDAVQQLPPPQRKRLIQQMESLPTPAEARRAARRLRGRYRLSASRRKRLSELLLKGNSGALTSRANKELQRLAMEFEQRTLEMAQAVVRRTGTASPRRPGASRRSS